MTVPLLPALQFSLLGPPQILLHNTPLSPHLSKKSQAMLYYLALSPHLQSRTRLASLFWSDVPDRQARKNLRNIVPEARKLLGDYLYIDAELIGFKERETIHVDVDTLSEAFKNPEIRNNPSLLLEIATIYQGDFLEGFFVDNAPFFEEWVVSCREEYRYLVVDRLYNVANHLLKSENIELGMKMTRRLLQIERWHEAGHRILIQLLMLDGQRSSAISHYHHLRSILMSELGVEPDDITEALYCNICSLSQSVSSDTLKL